MMKKLLYMYSENIYTFAFEYEFWHIVHLVNSEDFLSSKFPTALHTPVIDGLSVVIPRVNIILNLP
jgi:hypothetical protein